MKPAAFRYARPETVAEALELLTEHGDEAKIIAGGQSLIPAMNFRLSYPSVLVDITRIPELGTISTDNGWTVVGAGVTQRSLERSEHLAALPEVAAALPWVGHLQTRNRGTVAGSIAHADPAAELPAVAVAVDAQIDVQSNSGPRTIAAADFFQGPFTTALADGELVTAVRFPTGPERSGRCDEVVRRHGDFAIAGVVLSGETDSGSLRNVRVCGFGLGGTPQRLSDAETVIEGNEVSPDLAREAGRAAAAGVEEPWSDIHGSSDFRRGAIGALVARVTAELVTA